MNKSSKPIKSSEPSRHIPAKIRTNVYNKQLKKCANNPSINFFGYKCLLWKYENGNFDNAGYQFDHIDEFCITKNNNENNIQALCPSCHSIKTKFFMTNKGQLLSSEIINGSCIMDIQK